MNTKTNSQTFTGTLSISQSGCGFVNTESGQSILIRRQDLGFALHREQITGTIISQDDKGFYGKITSPPSFLNTTVMGFVHHFYMNYTLVYCPTLGKRLMIWIQTPIRLSIHDRVMILIKEIDDVNHRIMGELNKQIPVCPLNSVEMDNKLIEASLELMDFHLHSETKVDIGEPILVERIDLTHLTTFTIDPQGSRDLDDALSLDYRKDGLHLMIHIADVSEFIYPGSKYWDQTIKNGNTFYGRGQNWPMIPRELADGLCSILPNKITFALTNEFLIPFLNDDRILDLTQIQHLGYYHSKVESKKQWTYEEVQKIINNQIDDDPYYQQFIDLCHIAGQVKKSFHSIKMYFPEEDGNDNLYDSHLMIEVLMLWTNHLMAERIWDLHDSGVFRNHPAPYANQKLVLNNIITQLNFKTDGSKNLDFTREELIKFTQSIPGNHSKLRIATFEYLLKDLMRKASYESMPTFHYALGFQKYLHFTSPIRRAADLINHCLLRGYQFGQAQLGEYIAWINEAETKQLNIEKTLSSFDFLRLLLAKDISQESQNNVFEGLITDINKNGVKVFLPDIEHTCYLHVSKLSQLRLQYNQNQQILTNSEVMYQILDPIRVKFTKMDYDLNRIDWFCA